MCYSLLSLWEECPGLIHHCSCHLCHYFQFRHFCCIQNALQQQKHNHCCYSEAVFRQHFCHPTNCTIISNSMLYEMPSPHPNQQPPLTSIALIPGSSTPSINTEPRARWRTVPFLTIPLYSWCLLQEQLQSLALMPTISKKVLTLLECIFLYWSSSVEKYEVCHIAGNLKSRQIDWWCKCMSEPFDFWRKKQMYIGNQWKLKVVLILCGSYTLRNTVVHYTASKDFNQWCWHISKKNLVYANKISVESN